MALSGSKQKVYHEVLHEVRQLIETYNLSPGDKLPSERELSEQLHAGRSSVREALRAMELLGLIETKHGEGTFLSVYRPYQTVEILASFILRDASVKKDLTGAKTIIEKEAAKLAFDSIGTGDIDILASYLDDDSLSEGEKHTVFFRYLFEKTDNMLLTKIWLLMDEFSKAAARPNYNASLYLALLSCYRSKNDAIIERLFKE